jgi:hypothetical protein
MIEVKSIFSIGQKLNGHIVGYYDSRIHGLSDKLYRIRGFDLRGVYPEATIRFYLVPLDNEDTGVSADPGEVLSYEDIAYVYHSTKTLFENSQEVFKGVFSRGLRPMKEDFIILGKLMEEYKNRGLVIETDEEVVCASTEI